MEKLKSVNRRWWVIIFVTFVIIIIGFIALRSWSAVGSSLATPMRRMIGIEGVARLETILFQFQDRITRIKFSLGLAQAENPWGEDISAASVDEDSLQPTNSEPTPTDIPATATAIPEESNEAYVAEAATATPTPQVEIIQTTPLPEAWSVADLAPFADLAAEGVWQPYIENELGDIVAYRTFLQPDPERPYALVAVAAFDLAQTELHFVLGYEEPAKPGGPHGYGAISAEDFQPGKLLAAFNGGFIAEHGGYGAMADGLTTLAGKAGLATIGIFKDGNLRIGEWKNDLPQDGNYQAWRQNALMIIHNGEINPKVGTGTYIEWGANLDGAVVTIRSAIGLSEDNQVLYYFAGPKLSMPVLADAMQRVGVHNGMLLDINPTHAHFTAMRVVEGELVAEPLFPEEMNVWVDRYLRPWKQDFFYITAKE